VLAPDLEAFQLEHVAQHTAPAKGKFKCSSSIRRITTKSAPGTGRDR
jgi:hypothetical protein